GSASINVTGGQAPFTYQWSPGGGTGVSATGLQAGNYTITVRDRNNCQSSVVVEITERAPLSQNIQSTDIACNGGNTGTATVTASGGTTPYTYSWSNGAGNAATASLLVAGNYTVTVTDAHGCTSTQSVAITQPPALTASITSNQPVSCYGGSNATTTVTAGGGTAPYDYSWSPSGGMLSTATGLAAGSYTVTVRDANNCIRSVPVTITQPNALLASVGSTTNVSCNGGQNGTASTNVSGGTAPYQYVWSPIGTTTANVTGLAAGSYSVSITDARGCQTVTAAIIQEPPLLQTTVLAPVDVSCYGGNDGSATIVATGGTTPYTYNWSAGGSVSTSANGLPAGSYTVTVTDANACSNTALVVINQPALLSATPTVQNSPLCYGDNSGAASVSVSGGTGPYTYQWSPSGGTDTLASFLPAGIYTVAIRDANGCTSTASATITQPPLLTAAVATVDATCGASNGSASVTPAGGTAPYTYFWSPGNTTTSSISSVPAGSYSVVITDANGCRLIQSVAVSNIGGPTLANGSVVPVLCAGAMTGAAT
ncbi:MAG TPA: SprB repeat-containing protein, partial [Bacteroidia bacterium]|nr:SprB repeat-containing protein [Bacteroidia bacterium]